MATASSPSLRPRAAATFEPGVASVLRLDALHVVVAEAEMVADLVDEDVAHEVVEILAGLAPVIEDGSAVEKDDVGLGARVHHALARQRDAAIEAADVERAVQLHLLLGLGVGKFLDANDDAPEMPLQRRRYGGQPALGQRLDVGPRRPHARHPAPRRAPPRPLISAARSATCRRGEPISVAERWSRHWRGPS